MPDEFVQASFAQQRVWTLARMDPSPRLHNVPLALRVFQALDARTLRDVLQELGRRHAVLTTAIRDHDGRIVQVPRGAEALSLEVHDLRTLPSREARETEAAAIVQEAAWRHFDLEQGHVARTVLITVSDAEAILVFVQHHIVTDGWSTALLLDELSELYRGIPRAAPVGQYADYAAAQRTQEQEGVLADARRYWAVRFADGPRFHFPTRAARRGLRAADVGATLPATLAASVERTAARHSATPFVVLLAAFNVLLARWAGATDVVVGAPCADRTAPFTHRLLGCFLHIQPLRTVLEGEPNFEEALRRTRETVVGALDHAGFAFEAAALEAYRGQALPPFNVMVNSFDLMPDEVSLPCMASQAYPVEGAAPRADLNLYLATRPGTIRLRLAFDPATIDVDVMRALVDQYVALLQQATDHPLRSIWDYSLRGPLRLPDPRALLSREWHGGIPARVGRCSPERVAISGPGGITIRYGELDGWSRGLARRLGEAGLRAGGVVAILAHRVPALVPALVGVLRAGGAFVILDADQPVDWLDRRLRLSGAELLISSTDPAAPAPRLALSPLCEVTSDLVAFADSWPDAEAAPEDVACIAFTSGSSGQPRAVVGTHGGLTRFLPEMEGRYGIGAADRFAMLSSLMHDPLQRDIFTPLWFGGSIAVPPRDCYGESVWAWAEQAGVTVANLTPSFIRATATPGAPRASSLRLAFVIGEPLRAGAVDALQSVAPGAVIVNLYGATETQRALTHWVVPRDWREAVAPVGAEGDGVQAIILNRHGVPAGVGERGEIHLRSPHLARGYLGDPVATAECFVEPDMFRTGDAGRYRPDGAIDYLGRIREDRKVLGYRIDLGEVVHALESCDGIIEAMARVVADEEGLGRLVAYYVGQTRPAELRGMLAGRLPRHMVPGTLVPLEALPRNASGKLDSSHLPTPLLTREALATPFVPASTLFEQAVADLWSELPGFGQTVGIDDDYFSLGGTSLAAMRLLAQLARRFGRPLDAARFFNYPTIRDLAAQLEQAPPTQSAMGDASATATSPLQRQLWAWQRLRPDDTSYLMHIAFDLKGVLDADRLEGCLRELAARCDTARMGFHEQAGEVVARVEPSALIAFDHGEPMRPFKLDRPPLLRVQLAPTGPGRWRYVLVMHHIIGDFATLQLFTQMLFSLYATADGGAAPAAPVRVQPQAPAHEAWWRSRLKGAPAALPLPGDGMRPVKLPGLGGRLRLAFPGGLSASVREFARQESTTPYVVMLAAFKLLLARLSGVDDIVVGTPVTRRSDPSAAGALGPHFDVCALRTAVVGQMPFSDLVRSVRRTVAEAIAHSPMPFVHPLQAFFVLHELARQSWPAGIEATPVELLGGAVGARFELFFAIFQDGGDMRLGVEYAAAVYEEAAIDDLAGRYFTMLRSALACPLEAASSLPLLRPGEREALLESGRGARRPVEDLAIEVTDRALREQVDELADQLAKLGVGPEVLVAVDMPRSRDSVAAVLAILQAGGAFLPLDPEASPERNARLVRDADPAVVITGDQIIQRGGPRRGPAPLAPDRAAYVMYTSRPTGDPRGVIVTRGALASRLAWMKDYLALREDDVVLHKTCLTFHVAVWEMLLPFTGGCRLAVAGAECHADAGYLEQLIAQAGVTVVHFVPGMLRGFLRAGPAPHSLRSLRHVVCSGESLDVDLPARLGAVSRADLHNFYGPTEATIDVTAWRCTHGNPGASVPIGYPMPNTEVHVLDAAMQPCPAGVTGELYLGGPQLARGYINQPALTARTFVGSATGQRLYRTGDLARRRRDGAIIFVGRHDSQVRLRGCRIELGEIEAALRALPGVRDAVALVEDERLVAAYASDVEPEVVRQLLGEQLSNFMMPDVLTRVAQLPLLASGKLDRSRLPTVGGVVHAPRTAAEQDLCNVWREVLLLPAVGIDDDFFAIGGDSMLAMRMVFRAGEMRIALSVADVFRHRTIRALAQVAGPVVPEAQARPDEPFALLSTRDRAQALLGSVSP